MRFENCWTERTDERSGAGRASLARTGGTALLAVFLGVATGPAEGQQAPGRPDSACWIRGDPRIWSSGSAPWIPPSPSSTVTFHPKGRPPQPALFSP